MLEAVGNPVVVNPDKVLRRMAQERGWQTEAFRNPVTLRSRLPQVRPPEVTPMGGAAAAAALVGVAALAWWITRRTAGRPDG
jgi:hypothetical protein